MEAGDFGIWEPKILQTNTRRRGSTCPSATPRGRCCRMTGGTSAAGGRGRASSITSLPCTGTRRTPPFPLPCPAAGSKQLEEQLGGVVSPAARDAVLDRLMEVYAGELAEKAMSDGAVAQQKEVFKFRLDRDNYAFREQWLDSPDAARYYGNRFSRYLRAVLEEYAAKTVYQREAIYFDPQMRLIRAAAANGELLRIRMKTGSSFEVRPYGVLGDRQETYHYLVGLSRPDGTRGPEKEFNFRLSKIIKLDVSFRRSGRLTEKERTDIESSIRGKGVQFLAQQRETIRIRLTEEGRRDYGSQMHLRPPAQTRTAVDDGAYRWEYTFFCTEFQARAYFLKFCGEAKVVEPQSLRDTLAQEYRSGLRACGEEP